MLPVQNLFGGATTLPSGMVNSPLLAGFGAGENMQDQFTNNALNQTAQDTQNQQQQNILQQALLDNPNLAAQRQLNMSDIQTKQAGYDSGQQAALQTSALSAQTQANLAKMSNDQLEVVKNHGAAYVQADEFAKNNPEASMPGTKAHDQMLKMLTDAGIKDVPDLAGPQEMQLIHTRALAAPNTLDFIQRTQFQGEQLKSEERRTKMTTEATVSAAQLGKVGEFYNMLFHMPNNERVINTTQMAVQKQVDDKGQNYMTPNQVGQVTAIIRNNLSPEDRTQATSQMQAEKDADSSLGLKEVQAKAKDEGVPLKSASGNAYTQPELVKMLMVKTHDDFINSRVKAIVQAQFPAAKNVRADLPAANLDLGPSVGPTTTPPTSNVAQRAGPIINPQPPGGGTPPATAATASQADAPPVGGPPGASDNASPPPPPEPTSPPQPRSPGPADVEAYRATKPGKPYKGIDGHLYIKGG
jgi:hypothetical protein